MRWAEPGSLILLALAPLPWLLGRARPRLAWPTLAGFPKGGTAAWGVVPALLRGLAIACLAAALARPQVVAGQTRIAGRGVAIVVALDHSPSMNAVDFHKGRATASRLDAAKATLGRFIAGRPDDLIGLVVFANYPDLVSPPTPDHAYLAEAVAAVRPAVAGDEGTNLGDAIALSIDALRAATPRKKVLVLLTDGQNSPAVPHPLDPERAAHLARDFAVTLHTIAIGRPGGILRTVEPVTGLDVTAQADAPDFALLERLAKLGGGRAFVADDAQALDRVFAEIDRLEKSPVQATVRTRYRERYGPWVAAALGLLVVDRILARGRLRRLP
jgi:Ca-activated chloride channel homolog